MDAAMLGAEWPVAELGKDIQLDTRDTDVARLILY